jgi:hypothetical protein
MAQYKYYFMHACNSKQKLFQNYTYAMLQLKVVQFKAIVYNMQAPYSNSDLC